jgi:ribosome biogenesis protein Nip4
MVYKPSAMLWKWLKIEEIEVLVLSTSVAELVSMVAEFDLFYFGLLFRKFSVAEFDSRK